jgi:peptidoglycan/xylan/chitin deacetylase (PgdA/CDA1 family)
MWHALTRLASPGASRGSLSVLFFHRIFAERDPLNSGEPTAEEFATILGWLRRQFTIIPLSEGIRRLRDGTLPPAAAAITFDDGYRDNLEVAAPELLRQGVPATLFVASGFINGGIMFNDMVTESIRRTKLETIVTDGLELSPLPVATLEQRRQAIPILLRAIKYLPADQRLDAATRLAAAAGVELPRDLMLSSAQLRSFVGMGFEIGAHTVHHPILSVLPDHEASAEITEGRAMLEKLIDHPVGLFAYPNGRWGKDMDERHVAMARNAGFDAAFSTEPGTCRQDSDLWNLPRFTPWDKTPMRFHLRMLSNCLASTRFSHQST